MSLGQFLGIASYFLNVIGIIVCLAGLTLARRPGRRPVGYAVATLGFVIAASPLFANLFGFVAPAAPVVLSGS